VGGQAPPGLRCLGRARTAASGRAEGHWLFLAAPPKQETLTSNLLPIIDLPDTIYPAPAAASTYTTAGELLTAQARRSRSGWILRDGLAISFGHLRQAPLDALCCGDVQRHDTAEWADSTDSDTQYRFIDLLARTFEADHWGDLRWHNSRKHLHFCPTTDLQPRREGRSPGRRGHTVFGPYYSKNPDTISFYRHAAVTVRFRRFDGTWYCQPRTGLLLHQRRPRAVPVRRQPARRNQAA
jgi:hypothetical protein